MRPLRPVEAPSLGPGRPCLSVVPQARRTPGTGPRQTPDGAARAACTPPQRQQNEAKGKKWRSNLATHLWERMSTSNVSRPKFPQRGWSTVYYRAGSPQRRSKRGLEKPLSCSGSPRDSRIRTQDLCRHGLCTCHCLGLPLNRNEHYKNENLCVQNGRKHLTVSKSTKWKHTHTQF